MANTQYFQYLDIFKTIITNPCCLEISSRLLLRQNTKDWYKEYFNLGLLQ